MRYLYTFLLITCVTSWGKTLANNSDTLEYYYTYIYRPCKPQQAVYFRRAWHEGDWWTVKDFYVATGTIKRNGVYALHEHDTFEVQQGMFYYYHSNGRLEKKVRYINGLEEGVVKVYDTSGRLSDSGLYKKGIPYKARYKWNKDGSVVFKGLYDETGTGVGEEWEYHDDGKLSSYGKTGPQHLKDSVWTFYHKEGGVSSIEYYEKDSIKNIQCFSEDGTPFTKGCAVGNIPEPPYDINAFLAANMSYPVEARDASVQGRVDILFLVNEDGKIGEIRTIGAWHGYGLEEEAMRVISIMPNWRPGKIHNRPAEVYYILPVSFRME